MSSKIPSLPFPTDYNSEGQWHTFANEFITNCFDFIYQKVSNICFTIPMGEITYTTKEVIAHFLHHKFLENYEIWLQYYLDGRFQSCLAKTITRHCIDINKKNIRIKSGYDNLSLPSKDMLIDKKMENSQAWNDIWKIVKKMPERNFQIFYLWHIVEMPHKEIANALKITATNSSSILSRIHSELRKQLNKIII